jgi:hypothetical protein
LNQKLVFVSIIAIVAAFGISAIAVGLGDNMAFAAKDCRNGNGIGVNACNICVGVGVNVLGQENNQAQKC